LHRSVPSKAHPRSTLINRVWHRRNPSNLAGARQDVAVAYSRRKPRITNADGTGLALAMFNAMCDIGG
jgi:hypothetical protein